MPISPIPSETIADKEIQDLSTIDDESLQAIASELQILLNLDCGYTENEAIAALAYLREIYSKEQLQHSALLLSPEEKEKLKEWITLLNKKQETFNLLNSKRKKKPVSFAATLMTEEEKKEIRVTAIAEKLKDCAISENYTELEKKWLINQITTFYPIEEIVVAKKRLDSNIQEILKGL